MPGKVLTVTSGKGGVGKTTVTANLSVALASLGKHVAAVDTDIGLRNLDVLLGLENCIVFDLVDVVEGRCDLQQALVQDQHLPGLCLLPASQVYDKTAVSPADMMAICRELRSSNDYVLIDSPAGIELGFHNAIAGADDAIVVTTPELTAVRAADRIVGLLESSGRPPGRLVVNRIRPAMVRRGDMLGAFEVIEYLAIDLLGVVPEDEAVIAAAGRGEPVARELKTLAAQSFHNIAHRLLGEDVPFMPIFDEPESVFRRLRQLLRLR